MLFLYLGKMHQYFTTRLRLLYSYEASQEFIKTLGCECIVWLVGPYQMVVMNISLESDSFGY